MLTPLHENTGRVFTLKRFATIYMFYGLFLSKADGLIWAKTGNILPGTCISSSFVQKDIENFPVSSLRRHTTSNFKFDILPPWEILP